VLSSHRNPTVDNLAPILGADRKQFGVDIEAHAVASARLALTSRQARRRDIKRADRVSEIPGATGPRSSTGVLPPEATGR
jgi:hypothetical protein